MPTLVLLRGLPGSGKTTLASTFLKGLGLWASHVETDQYFLKKDGEYVFDPSKLQEAHNWAFDRTKLSVEAGFDVIVSNTFTQEWEMKKYLDLAEKFNYTVISLIVENRHGNQSVHGVPEKSLQRMRNRFEIKL